MFATPVAKRQRMEQDCEDEEEDAEFRDEEKEETVQERLERLRERKFEDGDLTSSVVKGRAADGLLELMRSR